MSGRAVYGTAGFCLSRRVYMMIFCGVLSFACWAQIVSWVLTSHLAQSLMDKWHEQDEVPCAGLSCYEVWTCRGFAKVTQHVQQPLFTLVGAVVFPLGFNACLHGFRFELRLVALWLVLWTLIFVACFCFDILYYESCAAYPGNAVKTMLLWSLPFPIRQPQQVEIRALDWFPTETVDKITNNFPTWTYYICLEVMVALFLLYTAFEARRLGMIFERGNLGMGVHYPVQWDEIINHDVIKQKKANMPNQSKFIKDCQVPLWNEDLEDALPYRVGQNYGTIGKRFSEDDYIVPTGQGFTTKDRLEATSERHEHLDEKLASTRRELEEAETDYVDAVNDLEHEPDEEMQKETEAQAEFRRKELNKEWRQEYRAEELAVWEAEDAAKEAEEAGANPYEVRMAYMAGFQKELAKGHRTLLNLTKNRTLHEHYRHAEREHEYQEMREERKQKAEEAAERLEQVRQEVEKMESMAVALTTEEAALRAQEDDRQRQEALAASRASRQSGAMASPVEFEHAGKPSSVSTGGPVWTNANLQRAVPSSIVQGTSGNFGIRSPVPSNLGV